MTRADHALARGAEKRGAGDRQTMLNQEMVVSPERDRELVELDQALDTLARHDPRKARVVELRFFGGLSVEEVSEVLSVSKTTVEGDWRSARAWLSAQMSKE